MCLDLPGIFIWILGCGIQEKGFQCKMRNRAVALLSRAKVSVTRSPLLTDQYFNLEPLHQMVNGDVTLLNNLLTIFVKDASATRDTLGVAINQGDYRSVKELAHGLKGICSVLEMTEIQELSVKIEALALEKTGIEQISSHFQTIDMVLNAVTKKLMAYLSEA